MYLKMFVACLFVLSSSNLIPASTYASPASVQTPTITPLIIKVLKNVPVSRSSSRIVSHLFTSPDSPSTRLMASVRQADKDRYIKIKAILETNLERDEPFLRTIINKILRAEVIARLDHRSSIKIDNWATAESTERPSVFSDSVGMKVTIDIHESDYARLLSEARSEEFKSSALRSNL